MKKNLAILMAAVTLGTMSFAGTSCDELLDVLKELNSNTPVSSQDGESGLPDVSSPKEDDSSASAPPETETGVKTTVTEAEWKAAFEALKAETVTTSPTLSCNDLRIGQGFVVSGIKQHENIYCLSYLDGESLSDGTYFVSDKNISDQTYFVFDENSLTRTTYQTDYDGAWYKSTYTYENKEEFNEAKLSVSANDLVANYSSSYSSFKYNEERKDYSMTISSPIGTDEKGDYIFSETEYRLKFENGKVVQLYSFTTMPLDTVVAVTSTIDFTYGTAVTIPQEALDAPEKSW